MKPYFVAVLFSLARLGSLLRGEATGETDEHFQKLKPQENIAVYYVRVDEVIEDPKLFQYGTTFFSGKPKLKKLGGFTYLRVEQNAILRPNCYGDLGEFEGGVKPEKPEDMMRYFRAATRSTNVFGLDGDARGVSKPTKDFEYSKMGSFAVVLEDLITPAELTTSYIDEHCGKRQCVGITKEGRLTRSLKKKGSLNIVALIDLNHFAMEEEECVGCLSRFRRPSNPKFTCGEPKERTFKIDLKQENVRFPFSDIFGDGKKWSGGGAFLERDGSLSVVHAPFGMQDTRNDRGRVTGLWAIVKIGDPEQERFCEVKEYKDRFTFGMKRLRLHIGKDDKCTFKVPAPYLELTNKMDTKVTCAKKSIRGVYDENFRKPKVEIVLEVGEDGALRRPKTYQMSSREEKVGSLKERCFDGKPLEQPKQSPLLSRRKATNEVTPPIEPIPGTEVAKLWDWERKDDEANEKVKAELEKMGREVKENLTVWSKKFRQRYEA